jgi:hypothetical protein
VIPSMFLLAGNTWEVFFKSKKDMEGDWGLCHPDTHEIWIWKKLRERSRYQTFLHEAVHAVMFTMGYDKHDEVLVEAVSQLVYQLLTTQLGEEDGEVLGTEESEDLRSTMPGVARGGGLHIE